MDAIFKKENVYVAVRNLDYNKKEEISKDSSFVVSTEKTCYLYGGRVYVGYYYTYNWTIEIDGIEIRQFTNSDCESRTTYSPEQTCAILNQIENLGVDTFLENYKNSLITLKQELATMSDKYEQELAVSEDDDKKKILENLRKAIRNIVCLIFVLSINLNAGLDNHQYIAAYEEVTNMYL